MRLTLLGLLLFCVTPVGVRGGEPLFVINRPTVIAFFPPVTAEELEKDPDTNEALADFQVYASRAREPLSKAGVDFHEVYAHSFRIRVGKRVVIFRPEKGEIGYYFVVPDKKPSVEYGVKTDDDLFDSVRKYLGILIK